MITALTLLGATLSAAAIERTGKIGIGLGAGYNTHAMTDINDLFKTQSGTETNITGGLDLGIDLKWHAMKNLVTGLELELLSPQQREVIFVGWGKTTENYSAMAISLDGFYTMPVDNVDYRIGGAVGMTLLNGATYKMESASATNSYDLTGSGFSLKLGVGADWYFTPNWTLNGDVGYRLSAVSPVTANSKELKKANGTDTASVDYSGLYSKVGVSFWF